MFNANTSLTDKHTRTHIHILEASLCVSFASLGWLIVYPNFCNLSTLSRARNPNLSVNTRLTTRALYTTSLPITVILCCPVSRSTNLTRITVWRRVFSFVPQMSERTRNGLDKLIHAIRHWNWKKNSTSTSEFVSWFVFFPGSSLPPYGWLTGTLNCMIVPKLTCVFTKFIRERIAPSRSAVSTVFFTGQQYCVYSGIRE